MFIRRLTVICIGAILALGLAVPANASVPPPTGAVTGGHGSVRNIRVYHPTRPGWYGIVNWIDVIFGYNGAGDADADALKVSSQLQNGPGVIAHQTRVQRLGYDGRNDLSIDDCRPSKRKLNSNNGIVPCDPLGSRADYDPDVSISTAHSDWQGNACDSPRVRGRIFGDFLFADGRSVSFSKWSNFVDADLNGCPTPPPPASIKPVSPFVALDTGCETAEAVPCAWSPTAPQTAADESSIINSTTVDLIWVASGFDNDLGVSLETNNFGYTNGGSTPVTIHVDYQLLDGASAAAGSVRMFGYADADVFPRPSEAPDHVATAPSTSTAGTLSFTLAPGATLGYFGLVYDTSNGGVEGRVRFYNLTLDGHLVVFN